MNVDGKFRRRVAVIGAGPAGLVAARHFAAPDSPFECKIYEQGSDLGGTWIFTRNVQFDEIGRPVHSCMYENLRTNLPKEVMRYPDFPFPDYEKSNITSEQVLMYLRDYADHFRLREHIEFNKCVKDVRPIGDNDDEWQLTIFDWLTRQTSTDYFDAVIVCNGQFNKQKMPVFKGFDNFQGSKIHSRQYRERSPYAGKRVLVIGGSFSGIDIAMELSNVAKYVYLSHHVKGINGKFPANLKMTSDVDYFFKTGAYFTNGENDEFDDVIVCTGYHHDYPFLHESCEISTDGYGVEPLYKHLINIEHPSMCLPAINIAVAPLQCVDVQIRFFYQLLAGSFQLPEKSEMYNWLRVDQKRRREELGFSARFAHSLGPLQKEYYDDLADTAGVQRIAPVISKLHARVAQLIREDISTFKNRNFKVVDEENFVELVN
ncbi:Hypothetical predicted protein [Cloeon dipterum]|uniref:Flavin-containing monooxygenase n=1 Tax=Cloeon dipterum TaxID=197152 RepID=A0A8S1DTN8_9INSE|nr:Hypothetical predicted protein [Cloeon dipterum]